MPEQLFSVDNIEANPYQKRNEYNDIPDLGRSIATDGLDNKPKARITSEGHAQLKNGHRRWMAFRWLRDHWEKEKLPNRYDGYTVMPVDIEELTDEQMLRGKVVENSQRKDLSPIERMEEMKQLSAFGYTSKQIAVMYPSMNDATVRGLLSFDNLLPEGKEALHTGKITQGTARIVNTMQKLVPAIEMAKLVEHVAEEKIESSNFMFRSEDITPEGYLIEELENMENVVELWNDNRSGKPSARYLWLLDMKTFPNKYLPVLLPEHVQAALGLTEDSKVFDKFLGAFAKYHDAHKEDDPSYLNISLDDLKAVPQELVAKVKHLINPTACSACPWYGKIKGTHYCGIRVCFERKERAWSRHHMHEASKKLGIAVYDPEADGTLTVLKDEWSDQKHKELFKKKGKDLRLAFMEDIDRKKNQSGYDGVPGGTVVGVVGATLKKLEQEKEEAREEKRQTVDVDAMVERMQMEKAGELLWEATLYVKSLFDAFPHTALESLYEGPRYGWGTDNSVPEPESDWTEKQDDEHTRRTFAYHMLDHYDTIDRVNPETLSAFAAEVVKVAKNWGVKIPASFTKTAQQMDAEIEGVAAETRKGKSQ